MALGAGPDQDMDCVCECMESRVKTTTVETAERGRSPLGAHIRFLMDGPHGNMIHSTVPPGMVGRASHFRTIDEYWYVLSGEGEVWRRLDGRAPLDRCTPPAHRGPA